MDLRECQLCLNWEQNPNEPGWHALPPGETTGWVCPACCRKDSDARALALPGPPPRTLAILGKRSCLLALLSVVLIALHGLIVLGVGVYVVYVLRPTGIVAFYAGHEVVVPVVRGTAIALVLLSLTGLVLALLGFHRARWSIRGGGTGWCVGGLLFHTGMLALLTGLFLMLPQGSPILISYGWWKGAIGAVVVVLMMLAMVFGRQG